MKPHIRPEQLAQLIQQTTLADYESLSLDELEIAIKAKVTEGDLGAASILLSQLNDGQQNILWRIIAAEDNPHDGHPVIIRDTRARAAERPPKRNLTTMSLLALTYVRAVKTLVVSAGIELDAETNTLLNQYWLTMFTALMTNSHIDNDIPPYRLRIFTHNLLHFLATKLSISLDEAKKRLDVAKDFVSLEDPSYHVATLSEFKDKTLFQADIVTSGLTEAQKDEYTTEPAPIWRAQLPEFTQNLVKHYQTPLTNGEHAIPTQLRFLPGCRNVYLQTCGHFADLSTEAPNIWYSVYHSGTLAHLTPHANQKEDRRLTALNREQMSYLTANNRQAEDAASPPSAPFQMITLNSEPNIFNADRRIVQLTEHAMQKEGYSHTNLPFNYFRQVSPNNYSGLSSTLKAISTHYADRKAEPDPWLTYIGGRMKKALNTDHSLIEGEALYRKLIRLVTADAPHSETSATVSTAESISAQSEDDQPSQKLLLASLACRYLKLINHSPRDPNNRNLSIAVYLIIAHLEFTPEQAIIPGCASGKDRTGLLLFTLFVYQAFFKFAASFPHQALSDSQNETFVQLLEALASTEHQPFMAGFQGATLACIGLKKETLQAIPEAWPTTIAETLVQYTSEYNHRLIPSEVGKQILIGLSPSVRSNAKNWLQLGIDYFTKPETVSVSLKDRGIDDTFNFCVIDSDESGRTSHTTSPSDESFMFQSYIRGLGQQTQIKRQSMRLENQPKPLPLEPGAVLSDSQEIPVRREAESSGSDDEDELVVLGSTPSTKGSSLGVRQQSTDKQMDPPADSTLNLMEAATSTFGRGCG